MYNNLLVYTDDTLCKINDLIKTLSIINIPAQGGPTWVPMGKKKEKYLSQLNIIFA